MHAWRGRWRFILRRTFVPQRNPEEPGSGGKHKRKTGKRDAERPAKRRRPTTIGHSALGENVAKARPYAGRQEL